ncbi:MAG: HD domain-containing protein [Candidatus Taylorbacteria bacterium]|nr:HD domain-containing protein [Candidatus Taylorbacteria bacterium]
MKKENVGKDKRNTELLYEISAFRFVPRMWRQFLIPGVATNVEHTFRVMWIALTLAKMEGVGNHEKILKIALLHDLPESRTGDVHYLSRQYVTRFEEKAVKEIFADTIHEEESLILFAEYEKRESIEAKIVKDADNLDCELEIEELKAGGHTVGKIFSDSRKEKVKAKLFTESARKMWDKIHATDPHDWHAKSESNRLNGGDWSKKAKKK